MFLSYFPTHGDNNFRDAILSINLYRQIVSSTTVKGNSISISSPFIISWNLKNSVCFYYIFEHLKDVNDVGINLKKLKYLWIKYPFEHVIESLKIYLYTVVFIIITF